MTPTTQDRRVPKSDFVTRIDDLLEKLIPDKTIPWPADKPPAWACKFKPRVIVDLGSGRGGFIRSVLLRLGQWGCLEKLERVVLIECDKTLSPVGEDGLRTHLLQRVQTALTEAGKPTVHVEAVLKEVVVDQSVGCEEGIIQVLEPYRGADLIIASHLTYYFGDGSGRNLLRPLIGRYLSSTGRVWCVIRKRDCPIYEARARTLRLLSQDDVKPFDYAEYFESAVLPSLSGAVLLAKADKAYLSDPAQDGRSEAAYFLMWRERPHPPHDTLNWKAVADIADIFVPLFDERHFILGRPME